MDAARPERPRLINAEARAWLETARAASPLEDDFPITTLDGRGSRGCARPAEMGGRHGHRVSHLAALRRSLPVAHLFRLVTRQR